jgi:putative endonuclease
MDRSPGGRPAGPAFDHLRLGRHGEDRVARWYGERGHRVVARNWRCAEGELDLVVLTGDGVVVFCEVKTRSSDRFGSPLEAVDHRRRRRLRAAATRWLGEHRPAGTTGVRFDVAAVRGGRVEVVEGAF